MLAHDLLPGVSLRLPEARDAGALYAVIDRERDRLGEWLAWPATQSLADTQTYIRLLRAKHADQTGLTLMIVQDGAPAGMVGFNGFDWANRTGLVGYWLSADAEGHGIMTAAVRALTAHGFALGLHRVVIRAAVANARSRAIPERLGFVEEGTERQAELVGGRWLDLVVYSRLADDGDGAPPPAAE